MSRPQAIVTQLNDDPRTRITRFDFAPGAETGWHEHELDYVVTPITDCNMVIELPDGGTQEASVAAGEAYRRDKGANHNVVNGGPEPMSFVEVELKDEPATAT